MTPLLAQAVARAAALADAEQDAIAGLIISEIESDERWEALLMRKSDVLRALADEAWREHESGRSEPLIPDRL